MEYMTAAEAAEAAKGLTFEKVWAALMESRMKSDAEFREMREQFRESREQFREMREQIRESQMKTDAQMAETDARFEKTRKNIEELSKNIGGVNNKLGRLTEILFSAELWKKFGEQGYEFTKQAPHVKFIENKQVVAEADYFLEDGKYVMPVEVKTELSIEDVKEHLDRIDVIRRFMDTHGDNRILVGAVAGGIVKENVLKYAQKRGLYVFVQTGDSVAIAEMPEDFKAREWSAHILAL